MALDRKQKNGQKQLYRPPEHMVRQRTDVKRKDRVYRRNRDTDDACDYVAEKKVAMDLHNDRPKGTERKGGAGDIKSSDMKPGSERINQSIQRAGTQRWAAPRRCWAGPRRCWAAPLGALVLVLAVVGIVTLVYFGTSPMRTADANAEREDSLRYAAFIYPAVLVDPEPFDSYKNAGEEFLRECSLWGALTENMDSLTYDSVGYMLLPGSMVTDKGKSLFGEECKFVLKSFSLGGITFEYDVVSAAYHIPITGHIGEYEPVVEKIKHKNDQVILTVGYISAEDTESETAIQKRMQYTLREVDGNLTILSVANN